MQAQSGTGEGGETHCGVIYGPGAMWVLGGALGRAVAPGDKAGGRGAQ